MKMTRSDMMIPVAVLPGAATDNPRKPCMQQRAATGNRPPRILAVSGTGRDVAAIACIDD
ncbi:hypothetical protein [Breoghania sp. L-A4]|uniref:hypothetical protein n=1 Tax=Breoghania sp. L-A4 TaxID=2304600 RepID=UPI0013C2E025|nr:hypothetical protein [Breoghania sp. L-A4]